MKKSLSFILFALVATTAQAEVTALQLQGAGMPTQQAEIIALSEVAKLKEPKK